MTLDGSGDCVADTRQNPIHEHPAIQTLVGGTNLRDPKTSKKGLQYEWIASAFVVCPFAFTHFLLAAAAV
jgi:hypothetical protein